MTVHSDKRLQWAVDMLKRFQIATMTGAITIYFQDGLVSDTETKIKQKPPFDKSKENKV